MVKTCLFCNNKIKDDKSCCWIHDDKPRKINKKKLKKEIEEKLREYGKIFKTGYLNQLTKYRDDISKHFEKERRRFKRLEERYNQFIKIWGELFDEEYQVIPNKFKEFNERK